MSLNSEFCPDCSNLLYPRESHEDQMLMFFCNSCTHTEFADVANLKRNTVDFIAYNYRTKEDINNYVNSHLCFDPTLPRDDEWVCAKCNHIGCVYLQVPENLIQEQAMVMVYICPNVKCNYHEVKGSSQWQHSSSEEEIDEDNINNFDEDMDENGIDNIENDEFDEDFLEENSSNINHKQEDQNNDIEDLFNYDDM